MTSVNRRLRPIIGITVGDPAGIGPEVAAKALKQSRTRLMRGLSVSKNPG